jgi:hypothetical protein
MTMNLTFPHSGVPSVWDRWLGKYQTQYVVRKKAQRIIERYWQVGMWVEKWLDEVGR